MSTSNKNIHPKNKRKRTHSLKTNSPKRKIQKTIKESDISTVLEENKINVPRRGDAKWGNATYDQLKQWLTAIALENNYFSQSYIASNHVGIFLESIKSGGNNIDLLNYIPSETDKQDLHPKIIEIIEKYVKPESDTCNWELIQQLIKDGKPIHAFIEGLKQYNDIKIRENFETKPQCLNKCSPLTYVNFGKLIDLEEKIDKISTFLQEGGKARLPHMFIVAPSGSGKSALMQYAEENINYNCKNGDLAIAITYNLGTFDKEFDKNIENAIALRILERFLCIRTQGINLKEYFTTLRTCFTEISTITLDNILKQLSNLIGNKNKIVLFIDECIKSPSNIVEATSKYRNGNIGNFRFLRFIYSSLKPMFDNEYLQQESREGGKIHFLQTQTIIENNVKLLMKDYLNEYTSKLSGIALERSISYILLYSSGNWRSLINILDYVKNTLRNKVLPKFYSINIKDLIIHANTQAHFLGGLDDEDFDIFFDLMNLAIMQIQIPVETLFSMPKNKEVSAFDLLYRGIMKNSINQKNITMRPIIPKLSILTILNWCNMVKDTHQIGKKKKLIQSSFCEQILQILNYGSSTITNGDYDSKAYISFEKLTVHFLFLKLLAWNYTVNYKKDYFKDITATSMPMCPDETRCFLPGHFIVLGKNIEISLPTKIRILQLNGTSTFSGNKDISFFEYSIESSFNCSEEKESKNLQDGDFILPGAKNQAFADSLQIIKIGKDYGLHFIQSKYSSELSSRKLKSSEVVNSLKKLIQRKGKLYDISNNKTHNQIAKLNVKEENVILSFITARKSTLTFNTLNKNISKEKIKFKGTIIICNPKDNLETFFGETFKNLPLITKQLNNKLQKKKKKKSSKRESIKEKEDSINNARGFLWN